MYCIGGVEVDAVRPYAVFGVLVLIEELYGESYVLGVCLNIAGGGLECRAPKVEEPCSVRVGAVLIQKLIKF